MDLVGRYQIIEELGRGAHGIVYKALDPAIGRTIAIKAIAIGNLPSAEGDSVHERILREARLAGTLSHPSIVMIYDVVDSPTAAYIVMEFIDGPTLENAISAAREHKPGVLNRAAFSVIFKQVAQALDYAHRKGVIHRDVKPANIMLTGHRPDQTSELIAKIADFGVAKFSSSDVTRQLGGPSLVGTPNYMSPELISGAALTGASDQFSLAVIAYEILVGKRAFSADSIQTLLYRICHEPAEQVHFLNSSLSPTVAKVMQRALAKNPDDRFATCSEFAGALEFALGDSPQWQPGLLPAPAVSKPETRVVMRHPEADPPPISTPEERTNWGKNLALIAALCLAVGFVIILIVRMNSGFEFPSQILESKTAASPTPPSVDELKPDIRPPETHRVELPPSQPTKLPEPAVPAPIAPAKKAVSVRQVKQVAPAPTSGDVDFTTDPPNVSIVVDGAISCQTPCSFPLASGRHTLTANLFGFGVARRIFNVPQDTNVFIPMLKSVGVLLITSNLPSARVSVDGSESGTTPVTLRLSPGVHRVSVFDGARWHDETVQVTADEVHTREFRF